MERKSSTQIRRFFNVYLPIENVLCWTFLKLKIFNHQIVANLRRRMLVQKLEFLKHEQKLGLLKKVG